MIFWVQMIQQVIHICFPCPFLSHRMLSLRVILLRTELNSNFWLDFWEVSGKVHSNWISRCLNLLLLQLLEISQVFFYSRTSNDIVEIIVTDYSSVILG